MKNGETVKKYPNEVLDYTFKWKAWLDKSTDTISTSTVTVDDGLTKNSASNDTNSTTAWLSGGTSGNTYKVTNKIVTAGGRTAERFFFVKVINPEASEIRDYQ